MIVLKAVRKMNKVSAVYFIVNMENCKLYIGSTNSVRQRVADHFSDFKHGRNSAHLQHAYEKYGEDNFIFDILEFCDEAKRIEREQYYIDTLNVCDKEIGYNIAKVAAAPQTGREVTQETRDKISRANTGKVKTPEMIAAAKKYWAENHEELTNIYIKARGKKVTLISPEGKSVEIFGIKKFCREQELDHSQMARVINRVGKDISCGGWTLPMEWDTSDACVTDTFGKEYIIKCAEISDFCKNNNITERDIYDLHTNGRKVINGWTKTGRVKRFEIVSPENIIYLIADGGIDHFCRLMNLSKQGVGGIISGRNKFCKGWTTPVKFNEEFLYLTDMLGFEHIIKVSEINEFAKNSNLSLIDIRFIWTESRVIRGWTRTDSTWHRRHLLSPNGILHKIADGSYDHAHKKIGIGATSFANLINGSINQCKGWILAPSDPGKRIKEFA